MANVKRQGKKYLARHDGGVGWCSWGTCPGLFVRTMDGSIQCQYIVANGSKSIIDCAASPTSRWLAERPKRPNGTWLSLLSCFEQS